MILSLSEAVCRALFGLQLFEMFAGFFFH